MIVCRQCGQAADERTDFCPSCGAFLEWEGEPVEPGARQRPAGERSGPGQGSAPGAAGPAAPHRAVWAPPDSFAPDAPADPAASAPPHGPMPSSPPAPPPAGDGASPHSPPGAGPRPAPDGGPAGGSARSGSVICLECGARNDGVRRFCRRCGSTLDLVALSGRAPRPGPTAPPVSDPGSSEDTAGSPGGPGSVPGGPGSGAGGLVARPPAAPVPAPPSRIGARAPAVPPTPVPTPGRGVQPTEPKARPAPVRPQRVEAEVAPGGPDCPQCGTANPPGRRFCRRCGADLPAVAASTPDTPELVEGREPWWRRLFRRRTRDGDTPTRSARAAYRRSLDLRYRLMRVVAVVAGVGVVAGGFGLVGLNPVSGARSLWDRFFPRDERVGELQAATDPAGVVESEFTPGNAVDGDAGTAWATTWLLEPDAPAAESCAEDESTTGPAAEGADGGDDVSPVASAPTGGGEAALVIALPEATELSKVSVQPGLAAGDPDRALHWQPTRLELRFDDGTCTEVDLADEAGFQDRRIDAPETSSVRVSVLDAAAPRAPEGASDLVAIGEVRVFAPK